MFDQNTGATGSDLSTFRIAYDDKYIYFAAQLKDAEPNRIRATAYRPNVNLEGDDSVGFGIDPFGTFSDGNRFDINPLGGTSIGINGGRAPKQEWLGALEGKSRRTTDGWETEVRIPWSIMRLPSAGTHDLRINFYRAYGRQQRWLSYANTNNGKVQNNPIWKGVSVPQQSKERPIKLLPYAYGGYEPKGAILNSGLDLKYAVNDDLDLVGSVNPDFRNIENQVLSVDFSYFERLAGETRPFFLEGQDYFNSSMDSPLFASQRIQKFDVGTKLYGKISPNTQMAFLNTLDFGHERSTVGSLSHTLGPRSNVTVQATQLDREGLRNDASFVGLSYGSGNFDSWSQLETSQDTQLGSGHRLNFGGAYFNNGLFMVNEYAEVSPDYTPRLGFAPQSNLKGFGSFVGLNRTYKNGLLSRFHVNGGYTDWHKYRGGGNYIRSYNVFTSTVLRNGLELNAGIDRPKFEQSKDSYNFGGIQYPNDPYRNVSLGVTDGEVSGHHYQSIGPSFNLRPTNRLQLSGNYQEVRHFEVSSQTIFSLNYDLNMSDSIGGRYIRQNDRTSWYMSFRRVGNRGAEYYLMVGEPLVDFSKKFEASVILKAVFPMDFKF